MCWEEYSNWRSEYLQDVRRELKDKPVDTKCKCDVDCSLSMPCPGVEVCPNIQGEDCNEEF